MFMDSGLSVIICCYNSENRIGKVLDHLKEQKKVENISWEVIVVDNASRDNTAEVARNSWKNEDVKFEVVYEEKPGLSNARIRGINASSYPYIVFVDDDNWVSEEYISKAYQIMEEHPDVGLAGGLGIPVSDTELPEWFSNYQDAYAVGPQHDNEGYLPDSRSYIHGAGMIMRKDVWFLLQDQGFRFVLSGRKGKSMSSGEDSEISSAFRLAGYRLWYDPTLVFRHILPSQRLRWNYLVKLAREFGKSYVILSVYSNEIWDRKGWQRKKSHNWFIGTAVSFYHYLRDLPPYLWLKIKGEKGARKEFEFRYQSGILSQRFKIAGRFEEIKREISGLKERLREEG
jgi:glycosyltransferase involved in cell wall biosynthesis